MNFVERHTVGSHHTLLEQLALSDSDGANRIDGLHSLFDLFFEFAIKQRILHTCIGVLCCESDDDFSSSSSHVLLDRGLNTLLCDDERLHADEVTVGGDHVNHIVNFSTVAADLPAGVVGLVVVSNEGSQGVLTNAFRHTESHDDMHLGEVSVKFLLCHFVDTADDVFIRLTDGFANSLEIPWMTRGSDGVPSLRLPLVTLFTRCCACLCTDFLCHVDPLGVSCGGYPTCRLPTDLPYLKEPHDQMRTEDSDSATS